MIQKPFLPACGAIVAVSASGIIGRGGIIPWHYPEDLKRFKRITTAAGIVLMGRVTWESLPRRPLPHRRNLVMTRTRTHLPGAECYQHFEDALAACQGAERVWIIGGAQLFAYTLPWCDVVDATWVTWDDNDSRHGRDDAVYFPELLDMSEGEWRIKEHVNQHDRRLRHRQYIRRAPTLTVPTASVGTPSTSLT